MTTMTKMTTMKMIMMMMMMTNMMMTKYDDDDDDNNDDDDDYVDDDDNNNFSTKNKNVDTNLWSNVVWCTTESRRTIFAKYFLLAHAEIGNLDVPIFVQHHVV
jgi:hypothetical protein